jgi:hypothetical protein
MLHEALEIPAISPNHYIVHVCINGINLIKSGLIGGLCETYFHHCFRLIICRAKFEETNYQLHYVLCKIFLVALHLSASQNIKLVFKYFYNYSIIL